MPLLVRFHVCMISFQILFILLHLFTLELMLMEGNAIHNWSHKKIGEEKAAYKKYNMSSL